MKLVLALLMSLATTPVLFAENTPELLPPPEQGFMQTLIMISVALIFFYFILWRPEQKRRKTMEAQRNALKKGDKVVAMGIVGTVSKIQENTIVLKMVDGSEIEFLKAAITDIPTVVESDKK